jgi:hypothetical protein
MQGPGGLSRAEVLSNVEGIAEGTNSPTGVWEPVLSSAAYRRSWNPTTETHSFMLKPVRSLLGVGSGSFLGELRLENRIGNNPKKVISLILIPFT